MKANTTRPLGPCVSCSAMVPDNDAPPYPGHAGDCELVAGWMRPDPRDAELARLRAIVRDVARIDPLYQGALTDDVCGFCLAIPGDGEPHRPECAWRRAREEAGKR